MKRLTLIGTNHNDPAGPRRLYSLLEALKPDYIGVESCVRAPEIACRLREHCTRYVLSSLRRHKAPVHSLAFAQRAMRAFLPDSYEPEVCLQYVADTGAEMRYIDHEPLVRTAFAHMLATLHKSVPFLLAFKNDLSVVRDHITRSFNPEAGYALAARVFHGATSPEEIASTLDTYRPYFVGDRDEVMATRVREMLAKKDHVVAVAGTFHLFDDPQGMTLYERVKDLKPLRLLLSDADHAL